MTNSIKGMMELMTRIGPKSQEDWKAWLFSQVGYLPSEIDHVVVHLDQALGTAYVWGVFKHEVENGLQQK